jgi:hypothetical protein
MSSGIETLRQAAILARSSRLTLLLGDVMETLGLRESKEHSVIILEKFNRIPLLIALPHRKKQKKVG